MDSKTRMLKAWRFEEPDRVPIEMFINPKCLEMGLPGAEEIREFQENEADNFQYAPLFDWGFFGLDSEYREDCIEDVPGQFKRMRRLHSTPVGEFDAVTKHTYDDLFGDGDPGDYHWEKRFVETLDDFRRLAEAPRAPRPFDADAYNAACAKIGGRGIPATGLRHPLGDLVRNSDMVEAYSWLLAEPGLVERYLESCTEQKCASLAALKGRPLAAPPVFRTFALEMLIPPWLGKAQFERWVFPCDKRVNDAIHGIGGCHFAHSHGKTGEYLELFADMGVDAVEPLEPPPYGDNRLAEAKRRVGKRMVLCGNVPSQAFALDSFEVGDVRDMVKQAIEEGAPGGGFFLRTTGSAHVGNGKTRGQRIKAIQCGLAMIEAWREFGAG